MSYSLSKRQRYHQRFNIATDEDDVDDDYNDSFVVVQDDDGDNDDDGDDDDDGDGDDDIYEDDDGEETELKEEKVDDTEKKGIPEIA